MIKIWVLILSITSGSGYKNIRILLPPDLKHNTQESCQLEQKNLEQRYRDKGIDVFTKCDNIDYSDIEKIIPPSI